MCDISFILEGEDQVDFEDLKDLSVGDIECYKYARRISCDVECTFSQYKSLFLDDRHRFMMHNLKMTFGSHCNSASLFVRDTDDFWRVLCVIIGTSLKKYFLVFKAYLLLLRHIKNKYFLNF
jgi:hypothetical protein